MSAFRRNCAEHAWFAQFCRLPVQTHVAFRAVKVPSTIGRALALLAVVGLALAPMVRPAFALPAEAVSVPSQGIATDLGPAMAGMPGCPEDVAPVPDCGKDCPFPSLCMGNAIHWAPPGPMPHVFATIASANPPDDDTALRGIAQPPPARPPKL